MTEPDLPVEVRDLIASAIDSTDQLDVLLLLLRAPSQVFHVDDIVQATGLSGPAATAAAATLHVRRLLTTVGGSRATYQYAPATIGLHAAAEGLAVAWSKHPIAVVKLIYDKPNRELRTFADAFRFRRRSDR